MSDQPVGDQRLGILEAFRSRPQVVLDRLVDGELGLEDQGTLLAALDDEPGAWRQCALAFVEAQSFGWQLSRIANESLLAQESSPRKVHAVHRRVGRFTWPLALAASVLVAFALGGRLAERDAAGPQLAGDTVDGNSVTAETEPLADGQRQLTSLTLPADGPGNGVATELPNSSEGAIELPVADSEVAAVNAAERSLAISRALAQQFERDGFEVNREQQLWPVELPDGRRVLVPVEEVHIQSPEVQRL